jgi:hypothetical protein
VPSSRAYNLYQKRTTANVILGSSAATLSPFKRRKPQSFHGTDDCADRRMVLDSPSVAYKANIVNVMVASPSDVPQERVIARDVIAEWNAVHAKDRKIALMPLGWETHSTPDMSGRPQAIINGQLLKDTDILVAMFWTRIGSPTGAAKSGTVEEIEEHIRTGKPVMIYFSSVPVRPDSIDDKQYSALKEFRESLRERGLFEQYESLVDFRSKLARQLAQTIISRFPVTAENDATDTSPVGAAVPVPRLNDSTRKLLIEASEDQQGIIMSLQMLSGCHVQTNGREFIGGGGSRAEAQWRGAVAELERLGLVEDRAGQHEVFSVTDEGYRIADLLKQQ